MRRTMRANHRLPAPWRLALAGVTALVVAALVVAVAVAAIRPRGAQRVTQPGPVAQSPLASSPLGVPPSPPGPTPTPGASGLALTTQACITAAVTGLSPEGLVGQLLMVGTPVADPQAVAGVVERYRLGGVFLAGRSTQPAALLRQGIQAVQASATASGGVALQIAIDQEGGQVQTLKGPDFPLIPAAVEQGRWDSATLRRRTTDWASRLTAVGVTMDLAPIADTVPAGTAADNPPIGAFARQFGSTPDAVGNDVATVVAAAQAAGLVTTLKHFPGLGRVRANTDTSTDAVDATTTADDPFLKPFISGIAAGSGAVMISSARYPRLDATNVAAFSTAVVTGLLRQRLGYSGLVISDDLGAAAAVRAVAVGDRAVRFIRAGGDLVLTVRSADAAPMAAALQAAVRDSPAFRARAVDGATHVLQSKYRSGLLKCPGGAQS